MNEIKKIGLLCTKEWINRTIDNKMLIVAFSENGIEAEEVVCNLNIDYSIYDAVIVRATWGYQDWYDNYLQCLKKIERESLLLNPAHVIEHNIDKVLMLQNLDQRKIPHIDTIVVSEDNIGKAKKLISQKFGDSTIVLKPSISASGWDTYKMDWDCQKSEFPKEYFERIVRNEGKRILVQRYMEEVREGEISLIYIKGNYSHAIRRFPDILSEGKESKYLSQVDENIKVFGNHVYESIKTRSTFYMRIDLVVVDSQPIIMEIEMNEPDFFYRKCQSDARELVNLFVCRTIDFIKEIGCGNWCERDEQSIINSDV